MKDWKHRLLTLNLLVVLPKHGPPHGVHPFPLQLSILDELALFPHSDLLQHLQARCIASIAGGADPVQHIETFKGRCPLIHIKDIYSDAFRGAWTEVGTGIVNIAGSIEAGVRCGADWFVVEQDQARDLAPMDSIKASIDNLKKMGFV